MAETPEFQRKRSLIRNLRRIAVVLLTVAVLGGAAFRWVLPEVLAWRIRTAVAEMGFTRYEFELAEVGLRRTRVEAVRLDYPGWSGDFPLIEFHYGIRQLLRGRIEVVEFHKGLLALDLDRLQRVADSGEDSGVNPDEASEAWTVRRLREDIPINRLILQEAAVRLERNGRQESLLVNLRADTGGEIDLRLRGEDSLPMNLGLSGTMDPEKNTAVFTAGGEVRDAGEALDFLWPEWRKQVAELPVSPEPRSFQGAAGITIQGSEIRLTSLEGRIALDGMQAGPWRTGPVTMTGNRAGDATVVSAGPVEIRHESGFAEASATFRLELPPNGTSGLPALTVSGLSARVDLEALPESPAPAPPSLPASANPAPQPAESAPSEPVAGLLEGLPLDSIQVTDGQLTLVRGESEREVKLSLHGNPRKALSLQLTAEGLSGSATLTEPDPGVLTVAASVQMDEVIRWLGMVSPEWQTALPPGAALSLGRLEGGVGLEWRPGTGVAVLQEATATVTDAAFEMDGLKLTAPDVRLEKNPAQPAFRLTVEEFSANRNDGQIGWQGPFDLELTPGDPLALSGRFRASTLRLAGQDFQPFEIRVKGTTRHFTLDATPLTRADESLALSHLRGTVALPGDGFVPTVRLLGQLEAPVPQLTVANEPEDAAIPGAATFPLDMFWSGMGGPQSLEVVVGTGHDGKGLTLTGDGAIMKIDASLTVTGDPLSSPLNLQTVLEMEHGSYTVAESALATVEKLRVKGELEDGIWEASGTGTLNGNPLAVGLRQEITPGKLAGTVTLGPVQVWDYTALGAVAPGLRGVTLSSGVHAELATRWDGAFSSSAAVTLTGGRLDYPESQISLQGVNGTVKLSSLTPPRLGEPVSLHLDRVVAAKGVELANVNVVFQVEEESRDVTVQKLTAEALGGTVAAAEPFVIRGGGRDFSSVLNLRDIETGRILDLLPEFKGEIDATVNGRVPIQVKDGRLTFLQGHLELNEREKAVLSFNAEGLLTSTMKEGTSSHKAYVWAEKALGNLKVELLKVDLFDPQDPTHPVKIQIVGEPLDPNNPLPQVTLNIPVEDEFGQLKSGVRYFLRRLLSIELD